LPVIIQEEFQYYDAELARDEDDSIMLQILCNILLDEQHLVQMWTVVWETNII